MTHMYFSARAEGRISYGHLGRTDSWFYYRSIASRVVYTETRALVKARVYDGASNRNAVILMEPTQRVGQSTPDNFSLLWRVTLPNLLALRQNYPALSSVPFVGV